MRGGAAAVGAAPGASGEAAELRAQVGRALEHLPENQRRAVELAFYEGLTHRQIAERVAQPLGTVKTQIRLAMAKLRALLDPSLLLD